MSSDKNVTELHEKVVKRSSVKGRITKFKNYLINLQLKKTLSSVELIELSLKLENFENLSNQFESLQSQIELLNADTLSQELDERDDIEQAFITNIATARSIIKKYSPSTSHNETSNNLNSSSSLVPEHHEFAKGTIESMTVLLLKARVFKKE
ncbi:hypothetical protein ACJJTC_010678 [Scirpophaga incertulas]